MSAEDFTDLQNGATCIAQIQEMAESQGMTYDEYDEMSMRGVEL